MSIPSEFAKALKATTKTLHKEKKRRERDARSVRRAPVYSDRITIKEAVFEVLPRAAAAASDNGKYEVPARNLYYSVRPLVQEIVDDELRYNYFSQTLLVEYQRIYGPITGLVRDPRGVLHEPHTGKTVPLGTRNIGSYEFPAHVFNKILYVEKEGFMPIFEAAQLADRFDLAIAAGKGQPTEAVRELFGRAEGGNYQLFVLHDADPDGYSIARTIARETRRMPDHNVEVIDLGLTVADAIERDLPREKFTRKKALPYWMQWELTDAEPEWFDGVQIGRSQWECTRVELNALRASDLVEFIEAGLAKHGATSKVVPPQSVITEKAEDHHREQVSGLVRETIAEIVDTDGVIDTLVEETAEAAAVDVDQVTHALADNPPEPWRRSVRDLVDGQFADARDAARARVRELLAARGIGNGGGK